MTNNKFSLKSSIQTGLALGHIDRISGFSQEKVPENKRIEELFEICDDHYLKHGDCEGCEYFENASCKLKEQG